MQIRLAFCISSGTIVEQNWLNAYLIFIILLCVSLGRKGGELSHHETMILGGALDLTQKTATNAMTPISETKIFFGLICHTGFCFPFFCSLQFHLEPHTGT